MTTLNADEFVLMNYGTMQLKDMAQVLGVSASSAQQRAYKLIRQGRLHPRQRAYQPPWTEDEDEYLAEFWGIRSDKAVARHLGRTVTACQLRVKRALGITRRMQFLTSRVVGDILGYDAKRIAALIDRGYLQGQKAPFKVGPNRVWRIDQSSLERFMRRYPWQYDRTRIEKGTYWRNLAEDVWRRDPWLTATEAAARLSVCTATIHRHCQRGWLKGEKAWGAAHQGVWRIPESALARFERRH
jgi:hypothetical protein